MRHKKQGRKLNRTWEHRKAMFNNMARSLITHGRIQTTVPKAKELRGVVEGLVTLALRNDLHARRQAFKVLNSHQLVKKLFDEIGPRFADSPKGGYTRVVKLAHPRPGDSAPLAIIEFIRLPGEEAPAKKSTKAQNAKKAEPDAATETPAKAEESVEAPAVEEPVVEEAAAEEVVESPAEETAAETPEKEASEALEAEAATDDSEAEPQPEEDSSKS